MAMVTSAVVGLAATAAATAMSFAQAAEQNSIKNKAEAEAEKALAEAKKRLDVNVYEALDVNLDAFRRQQEGLLSAAAQATAAGVESERGVAATAGRVQAGVNEAMAGIREAEVSKLEELELLTAGEESRLKDIGAQISLDEAAGAQAAAANAAEMEQMALAQGMEGVTSAIGQAAAMAPLFSKTKGARQAARLERQFERGQKKGVVGKQYSTSGFGESAVSAAVGAGLLTDKTPNLTEIAKGGNAFQDWLSQRTPDEFNTIMSQLGLSAPQFR